MLEDNKRPDGNTLLSWAKGKPLAWDVTVPDTYAESHIYDTVSTPGAAAHQAAQHKIANCQVFQAGKHTRSTPLP